MKLTKYILILFIGIICSENIDKNNKIITYIYSHISPINGELLAIANIQKLPLVTTPFFIQKELNLLQKFLIMSDIKPFISHQASHILLNLILCDNKSTYLRTMFNILLEGYILEENENEENMIKLNNLFNFGLIDTLLKVKFYYYNDLQAKEALIILYNKEVHKKQYSNLEMIEFLDRKFKLLKPFKEMLIGMIMRLSDSDKGSVIEAYMEENLYEKESELKIEKPYISNKTFIDTVEENNTEVSIDENEFNYINQTESDHINNLNNDINKMVAEAKGLNVQEQDQPSVSLVRRLSKEEAHEALNSLKASMGFSFKQKQEKYISEQSLNNKKNEVYKFGYRFIEQNDLPINKTLHVKLNEIKNDLKNTYMDFLFNKTFKSYPYLDNKGIMNRSIYPKYENHIKMLLKLNELLMPFPLVPPVIRKIDIVEPKERFNLKTDITKSFDGVNFTMKFKQEEFARESMEKIISIKSSQNKTIEFNSNVNPVKGLINEETFKKLISFESPQNNKENIAISEIISGLFRLLRKIQENNKCSDNYICAEIGIITGPFDIKEKNKTEPFLPPVYPNKTENETKKNETPSQPSIIIDDDEDCDELTMKNGFNPFRFQEVDPPQIEYTITNKLYRKIMIGNMIYSQEIFNEGMNMIVVKRDANYDKLYEKTFNTGYDRNESEEMANILGKIACDSIIIISGMGNYKNAITQRLIKELKQIGLGDNDIDSFQDNKALLIIGRRGLCRNNGFTASKSIPQYVPQDKGTSFTSTTVFNLEFDISKDNRFNYNSPTVCAVTPSRGSILGGQHIQIKGLNLGNHTTDINEILVKGVMCGDFLSVSNNEISCVTRASTIMGSGAGGVVVKMKNGLESPSDVCNYFEYVGQSKESIELMKKTFEKSKKMANLPTYINDNSVEKESIYDYFIKNRKRIYEKGALSKKDIYENKINSLVQDNIKKMISTINPNVNIDSDLIQNNFFVNKRVFNGRKRFQFVIDSLKQ